MTETEAAPTCYRHIDRETYVRCTRCDRSICPDCMNEAAVGFQCPECVREGNKSIRQARTVFGGRVAEDANITKVLLGINVIAYVMQLASSDFTQRFQMAGFALFAGDEYYRMITSAFLHGPIWHIGFNMYALLAFGSQVERLLGATRYVVLYLVAALGGSVATYLFLSPYDLSLGASGAVFGLFGAYFVMARSLRADTSQLVLLIGINLAFGFAVPNVNVHAHLGGLVVGAAVTWVYAQVPRQAAQRAVLQLGGAALITLVLVVATVVRTNDLRQNPPPLPPRFTTEDSARSAVTTSSTGAPSR